MSCFKSTVLVSAKVSRCRFKNENHKYILDFGFGFWSLYERISEASWSSHVQCVYFVGPDHLIVNQLILILLRYCYLRVYCNSITLLINNMEKSTEQNQEDASKPKSPAFKLVKAKKGSFLYTYMPTSLPPSLAISLIVIYIFLSIHIFRFRSPKT